MPYAYARGGANLALLVFTVCVMLSTAAVALLWLAATGYCLAGELVPKAVDPCAAIAGQEWVSPKDVRACFSSFPVDPEIKANVSCSEILRV